MRGEAATGTQPTPARWQEAASIALRFLRPPALDLQPSCVTPTNFLGFSEPYHGANEIK